MAVTFTPNGSGTYQTSFQIASNDAVSSSRSVAVSVTVTDPLVTAAPGRVDFGELAVNPGPQTTSITLTNGGGAAELFLSDVSFLGQGGNGFSVMSFPESIAPGASGQVVISFNPASATNSSCNGKKRVPRIAC